MARSTGLVITAGALVLTDQILSGWEPSKGVKTLTASVIAAFVSAGLDKVIPGLGTGMGVLLLVGAVLTTAPKISARLFK